MVNSANQSVKARLRATMRYLCRPCGRTYTPEPTPYGYDEQTRCQALRLYADGMNLRRIARQLGVVHQTVANWVAAHADSLPEQPPQPASVETAELDELYTFVGHKKPRAADLSGGWRGSC